MPADRFTMAEKKTDKWRQYFIGIVPPQPLFDEVLALKRYFGDHFKSKGALKSPPHITLHMPFRWKEENEMELITKLQRFASDYPSFPVQFNNFGCFSPRVIFIDVKKSDGLNLLQHDLQRFCKLELNLFNANYKKLPFHPHLTVAFRDLKKPAFHEAWGTFKDKKFEGEFAVNKIVLLKHNGKIWEEFEELNLNAYGRL